MPPPRGKGEAGLVRALGRGFGLRGCSQPGSDAEWQELAESQGLFPSLLAVLLQARGVGGTL